MRWRSASACGLLATALLSSSAFAQTTSGELEAEVSSPSPSTPAPSPASSEMVAKAACKASSGQVEARPSWLEADCYPRVIYAWEEGQIVPPGYERRTRFRMPLIYAGAAVFGATWAATVVSAGVGYEADPSPSRFALAIPLAGPFIEGFIHERGAETILVYSAALQGLGMAGLVWGLADHKTVLVRTFEAQGGIVDSWSMSPLLGPGLAGVGLRGDF